MSIKHITEYHLEIENLRKVSGSVNESVLRPAFQKCLTRYCALRNFTLVAELRYNPAVIPDGTIKDSLRLTWGYWEAKDEKDDLDKEIDKKIKRGYPTTNIIFEDSVTAVLLQGGEEIRRVKMANAKELDGLIAKFFAYAPPATEDFRRAIAQFKSDLPSVLTALREMIDQSHKEKPEFRKAADEFLQVCHDTINPEVEESDVREMLIQHILTKDIFLKVFGEDQFHKENNIARRLDKLEDTFFTGGIRREMVDRLKSYYSAITVTAASIDSYQEKQKFLKAMYEDFYKVYNPQAADRLGVVYTPSEIVDFMIKATDELVYRHFARHLYDKNVQILDPAVGTGTFITDLIEFIPNAHVAYKYENEIHANEVSILPYYIANLNIEYTYKQKTGEYKEFPNICFVDTLDNLDFQGKGQTDLIGSMSYENFTRIKRQNKQDISVIIGNPPYNANQQNSNDNNQNREYPGIDARIKDTYIQQSTAQKTKQYDMYKRFIRWASDRLGENGVLTFITNRAWLDSRQDDGFRKVIVEEFNEIYAIDLGGDHRKNPAAGNVFGIKVGVVIGIFIRRATSKKCEIHYAKCDDSSHAQDKLAFLSATSFGDIDFEHIVPNEKGDWLQQTDNDFDNLLCIANKQTKLAKAERQMDEDAVFKLFSLGVVTNRDEWAMDFDKRHLTKKIKYFCNFYNAEIARFNKESPEEDEIGDWVNRKIKWTRELQNVLLKRTEIKYSKDSSTISLYRPFVHSNLYYQAHITHCRYQMPKIFPHKKEAEKVKKNTVICFSTSKRIPFVALASHQIPSLGLFMEPVQCIPLYRYDKQGNRHDNITMWGRKQFCSHYHTKKITAEDIFHYTYAVFHNPVYLEKYAVNLKQEFPRLPFYDDFAQWVQWGKSLIKLHAEFEKQKPYPIQRLDISGDAGKVKLKASPERGSIIIDEKTQLSGVPPEAWKYQLGSRSALEWILNQYKEKKLKDPTVKEKFNTYQFSNHKEKVIDLLCRVCTVSVDTVKIMEAMKKRQNKSRQR